MWVGGGHVPSTDYGSSGSMSRTTMCRSKKPDSGNERMSIPALGSMCAATCASSGCKRAQHFYVHECPFRRCIVGRLETLCLPACL